MQCHQHQPPRQFTFGADRHTPDPFAQVRDPHGYLPSAWDLDEGLDDTEASCCGHHDGELSVPASEITVELLLGAGLDEASVFAWMSTGRIVTMSNAHLFSDAEVAEWERACRQYVEDD